MASFHLYLAIVVGVVFAVEAGRINFRALLNSTDPDSEEFAQLMDKFAERMKLRANNASDVTKRLANFRRNKQNLQQLRNKYKKAQFGVNKFSLMSTDEQKQLLGGMVIKRPSDALRAKRSALDGVANSPAPASFDFRTYDKVSNVTNQLQCGSCWAFASTAAIESLYRLRFNSKLDLSEQSVIGCTSTNSQCNGGDVTLAFDSIKTKGITIEDKQNYTAANSSCPAVTPRYFIDGYKHFGYNESLYAAQLYNYGPATMAFYVHPGFMQYTGGVLDFPDCTSNYIGMHAMLIVGYTDEYWIAKNSWGPEWGEKGYVRFRKGVNFCGFTIQVTAPFLNANTTTTPAPATIATTTTVGTPAPPMSGCISNEFNPMNNAARQYVLDVFNQKRSDIANGTFVMKNGIKAPAAKNMKKLTYNCTLEQAANSYIKTCNSANLIGNTYTATLAFGSVVPLNQTIQMAPGYLTSFTAVQQGTGMVVTDGATAFANDAETQIGCAYTTTPCSGMPYPTVLACTITPYVPNTTPIYQVGAPCKLDSDCTKAPYNKCDVKLQLCYA